MTPDVRVGCVTNKWCREDSQGEFNLGETYEKLADSVWNKYLNNSTKRNRFFDMADATKVKYWNN